MSTRILVGDCREQLRTLPAESVCSDDCHNARRRKRWLQSRGDSPKMNTCQVCEGSFPPSGRNQKYCSPACAKEYNRKRSSELYYQYYRELAPIRQIKCPVCQGDFSASGATRKYCSKPCAAVAKEAYSDDWNKSDAGKRSRARHLAQRREGARLWRAANADAISEKKALAYARDREKRLAQQNLRRAADPEKFRERDRTRRRRARAAEIALREMGLI